MAFSHTTTRRVNSVSSETVKTALLLFSASQLSAITVWSLVPRNEVEGVITQSDGSDINHQAMCERDLSRCSVVFFLVIISINRLLLFFASLFIYTPILLFFSLHILCTFCIMIALLSTQCAFRVGFLIFFFYVNILGTSSVFKFCPGATLDPCSQQGKKTKT